MWNLRALLLCGVLGFPAARDQALGAVDSFSVATYNLENYLDESAGSRHPKTEAAKDKIREMIRAMKPDVLAVEEIGGTNALLELRSSLRAEGLDYPHWSHVAGFDTNIHVAVLSRFPFLACRPHTNEGFLLNGRRFRVSRGFAEVDVQVNAEYKFTLIAAHLKSRREVNLYSAFTCTSTSANPRLTRNRRPLSRKPSFVCVRQARKGNRLSTAT